MRRRVRTFCTYENAPKDRIEGCKSSNVHGGCTSYGLREGKIRSTTTDVRTYGGKKLYAQLVLEIQLVADEGQMMVAKQN